MTGSARLEMSGSNHLAPFLDFVSNEPAVLGLRHHCGSRTQISEPALDLGVAQARIDLLVEPGGDLGWRVLGSADPEPDARLVPGNEIAQGANIRQRFGPRRRGDRQ